MMVDTHSHLQLEHFDADRPQVISNAREAGVVAIIVVGTDVSSSRAAIDLAERHPEIYAAVGIHPNDCTETSVRDLAQIAMLAQHGKVVAIGEIGLDNYWKKATPEIQREVFVRQIRMAEQMGKPVIIHNREAGQDILQTLEGEGINQVFGVFHCFAEDEAYSERVLSLGAHISFTGNLTYKKSPLPSVAREIPLDRLLLETDSPFMAPVPLRGKRNEPAQVRLIAEKLAEIKGVRLQEICERTTENAARLFQLNLNEARAGRSKS